MTQHESNLFSALQARPIPGVLLSPPPLAVQLSSPGYVWAKMTWIWPGFELACLLGRRLSRRPDPMHACLVPRGLLPAFGCRRKSYRLFYGIKHPLSFNLFKPRVGYRQNASFGNTGNGHPGNIPPMEVKPAILLPRLVLPGGV
jgi:hypothetical protein